MDTSGQPPRADDLAQDQAQQADQSAPGDQLAPASIPTAPAGVAPDQSAPASADRGKLFGYLAIYTVLRLALVVALTALLSFFMPLIVALLFAIIVQLPLSWLLFARPRAKVNDAIAQASSQRRAERARLQAALSGDTTT